VQTSVIGNNFGVEITTGRLQDLTEEQIAEVLALYSRFPVLVFRDQDLSPRDYESFGRRFGDLQDHTRQEFVLPGHPTIYVLSNKIVDGKPIGVHRDGMGWHTDGTYVAKPLETTMLYSLEVPPEGGDTLFADTRSAFADLDEHVKARIREYEVVHSFEHLLTYLDPMARTEITEEQRAANPEVRHPLVITRSDGSEHLYLTLGSSREIVGMDPERSRALLRELAAHVTQDRYVHRHVWRVGDVVVWNNLCSMHSATAYDDESYTRHVHRLWIKSPLGLDAAAGRAA
jgi:taurine dioxygenase